MNKYLLTSSTGIACCLLLAASMANAEVIRCIDNKGLITFTDVPCTTDMLGIQAPSVTAAKPAGKISTVHVKLAAAAKASPVAELDVLGGGRNDSPDERTVLGAKAYTDSSDIHLALAREHAAAERALNRNRWAFWRL